MDPMKRSDLFRQNAEMCAYFAECTVDIRPLRLRYKRLEAGWLALAPMNRIGSTVRFAIPTRIDQANLRAGNRDCLRLAVARSHSSLRENTRHDPS